MICNRCGNQNPDSAYFCSNCGALQNAQPTQPPPYQQPNYQQPVYQQPRQQYYAPIPDQHSELTKAQKALFIIGLVEAGIIIFWKVFYFFMDLIGMEYYRYTWLTKPFALLTSISVVLLCFLFAKKGTYKTILLIAFILVCLVEIYDLFLVGLVHHFFRHLF